MIEFRYFVTEKWSQCSQIKGLILNTKKLKYKLHPSNEEGGVYANFVEVCGLPKEIKEDKILDFMKKNDINIK